MNMIAAFTDALLEYCLIVFAAALGLFVLVVGVTAWAFGRRGR